LRKLRQRIQVAFVLASDQVYDLADWIDSPWVESWVLVKIGQSTLKTESVPIPEFTLDQLEGLKTWLDNGVEQTKRRTRPAIIQWGDSSYNIDLDPTGFPMIEVPPFGRYIHLFPISKLQYEAFLTDNPACNAPDQYDILLRIHPRMKARGGDTTRYEQLFVGGILPQEAEAFSSWLGDEYQLPEVTEWRKAYQWMVNQGALPVRPGSMSESATLIWDMLSQASILQQLHTFALFENGLNEWVYQGDAYAALGRTRPAFRKQLNDPLVDVIKPISGVRARQYGFRLIR
jgi:hypothetical protein